VNFVLNFHILIGTINLLELQIAVWSGFYRTKDVIDKVGAQKLYEFNLMYMCDVVDACASELQPCKVEHFSVIFSKVETF
jgi:hypothetical protein